jgi:hypothetical protein
MFVMIGMNLTNVIAPGGHIWNRTDISKLFHRNKPSRRIDDALTVLEKRRLVQSERDPGTGGRPVEMWTAT